MLIVSSILVNNVGGNSRRPMAMETFEQFWSGVEMNLKPVRPFLMVIGANSCIATLCSTAD
jgi:hypothetical protein